MCIDYKGLEMLADFFPFPINLDAQIHIPTEQQRTILLDLNLISKTTKSLSDIHLWYGLVMEISNI